MRSILLLVTACGLLAVPSAVAKDFGPGDLRVCGRHHCVSITNRHLLRILSDYYYGSRRVPRASRVRLGAPGFELCYKNGYASGMGAGTMLKRFRVYGLYCLCFEWGSWFWFPSRSAYAVRTVSATTRHHLVHTTLLF